MTVNYSFENGKAIIPEKLSILQGNPRGDDKRGNSFILRPFHERLRNYIRTRDKPFSDAALEPKIRKNIGDPLFL